MSRRYSVPHSTECRYRMYFCETGGSGQRDNLRWTGNCLFRLRERNSFSDNVTARTDIQGQLLRWTADRGFLYQEDDYRIVGYFIDESLFHVTWCLPKSHYTKGQAWNWPVGFQEALQIWLGKTICLLKREMNRNTYKVIEFRRETEVQSLYPFWLIAAPSIQNKAIMVLARFFCVEEASLEVEVCRNIFNQVMDACQQRSQAARELLVATTLEATIRTLYNFPITPKVSSKGLVEQKLNGQFKGRYLSKTWTPHCQRAIEAFKNLRNRNAHPDWLETVSNSAAVEKVREAVDDMLYLCRFYGYMILAMAELRVENPSFPTPHQQCGLSFIISSPGDPLGSAALSVSPEVLNLPHPFAELPNNAGYHAKMMAMRRHKISLRQPPRFQPDEPTAETK